MRLNYDVNQCNFIHWVTLYHFDFCVIDDDAAASTAPSTNAYDPNEPLDDEIDESMLLKPNKKSKKKSKDKKPKLSAEEAEMDKLLDDFLDQYSSGTNFIFN